MKTAELVTVKVPMPHGHDDYMVDVPAGDVKGFALMVKDEFASYFDGFSFRGLFDTIEAAFAAGSEQGVCWVEPVEVVEGVAAQLELI